MNRTNIRQHHLDFLPGPIRPHFAGLQFHSDPFTTLPPIAPRAERARDERQTAHETDVISGTFGYWRRFLLCAVLFDQPLLKDAGRRVREHDMQGKRFRFEFVWGDFRLEERERC